MSHKHASSKPGKMRKRYYQAPKHKIHRQLTVQVSGAEAKFPNIQRATIHKGDRVEIDRGQGEPRYADKDTKVKYVQGKVSRVDYKRRLVFVEDLKMRKRGNKVADRPVDPRNVTILSFNTADKRRKAMLDRLNARGEA